MLWKELLKMPSYNEDIDEKLQRKREDDYDRGIDEETEEEDLY